MMVTSLQLLNYIFVKIIVNHDRRSGHYYLDKLQFSYCEQIIISNKRCRDNIILTSKQLSLLILYFIITIIVTNGEAVM